MQIPYPKLQSNQHGFWYYFTIALIACVAIAAGVIYFFKIEPLYGVLTGATAPVIPEINSSMLGELVSTVTTYISEFPIQTVTGIVGLGVVSYSLYSKVKSDRVAQANEMFAYQESQAKQAAQSISVGLEEQVAAQKHEIEVLKNNTNDALLQESTTLVSQLQQEKKSLLDQNQALMDKLANTPVKIVTQVK